MSKPSTDSIKRPPLARNDYDRMIAAIDTRSVTGKRQRAMVAALYWLGLRTIEFVGAHARDFDLERGLYYPPNRAKGGRAAAIGIHPECLAALIAWSAVRPDSDWMFCGMNRGYEGKQISTQQVRKTWRILRDRAGLPERFVCHSARHGAAQLRLANGWNLRDIQEYLGHRNIATTQGYLEGMSDDEKVSATAAL